MKNEKIVQFVVFETALDSDEFRIRWERYRQSVHKEDKTAILQKHLLRDGRFKYISQHECSSGDFQFVFNKEKKSSKTPEPEVRKKLAGGYSILQMNRLNETKANESKIMIFISDPTTDLNVFRQFSVHGELNIYEAYYESCEFAYILELFVKNEYAADVLQQLKILTSFADAGIYKECHA